MRQILPLIPLLGVMATSMAEEPDHHPELQLIDLSLTILSAAGGSTASDAELALLQAGGHDPIRNGFTFQQVEISALGAVDPFFQAEVRLVLLDDGIELEEAFAQTTSLGRLQIEAGLSLAEFGRNNPSHPHSWAWNDRPLVVARLLGGDGMRGVGARVGWHIPLPWHSQIHAGVMDATNTVATSFGGEGEDPTEPTVGGRQFTAVEVDSPADLVWLLRWEHASDEHSALVAKAGASLLAGPNATGPGGATRVYGTDFTLVWQPDGHEHSPKLSCEAEILKRDYQADDQIFPGPVTVDGETLHDWGLYVQMVYGFNQAWSAGLRYEYASGSGDSVDDSGAAISADEDPSRDQRTRIAPLLVWKPSGFSTLRLQYNHDRFSHDDSSDGLAHTVWLGLEVMLGAHDHHPF